jgi:hypothetical protein
MKYIILFLLGSFLVSQPLVAQVKQAAAAPTVDPNAPYMKDKRIPSFSLTSIEGKEITNKQLPTSYKYTCIIIFSPDCSHCEHEASELSKNADKFKEVLFIWDSYREMDAIKKFAVKYKLAGQPNVIIGRDPKMTPFVAMYKNGYLLRVWEQGAEVNELVKIVQGN